MPLHRLHVSELCPCFIYVRRYEPKMIKNVVRGTHVAYNRPTGVAASSLHPEWPVFVCVRDFLQGLTLYK